MTTATQTLSTPKIESLLTGYRRIERYTKALAELNVAIEMKSIYNQALESVKYELKAGIEQAAKSLIYPTSIDEGVTQPSIFDELRSRGEEVFRAHYDNIDSYFSLNAAAGRATRLRKKAADLIEAIPALKAYVELLDEVTQVHEALTSLKPFVLKGRTPSENPKHADLSNTGTCAICGSTQKLTKGVRMVHHGFHITDGSGHYLGQRLGKCFGVDHKPRELSNEANVAYKKVLENMLATATERLADLKEGRVKSLTIRGRERQNGVYVNTTKVVTEGDEKFARTLDLETRSQEGRLNQIKFGIDDQEMAIKTWVRKPLYDELHPKK